MKQVHNFNSTSTNCNTKCKPQSQNDPGIYMLDTSRNCGKSSTIIPDQMMYMLEVDGTCESPFLTEPYRKLRDGNECDDYRINPNNNYTKGEQEWMLSPKSNAAIRKRDWKERQQLRIYPHMFRTHQPEDTSTSINNLSSSLFGVDYPVPMRFQLKFLQDRTKDDDNIDYDMRLKKNRCGMLLPEEYNKYIDTTFDYHNRDHNSGRDPERFPNQGIISNEWYNKDRCLYKLPNNKNDNGAALSHARAVIAHDILGEEPPTISLDDRLLLCTKCKSWCGGKCCDSFGIGPRTIGVPNADESRCGKDMTRDMTCSQRVLKARQELGIKQQPLDWYKTTFSTPFELETTSCGEGESCPKEKKCREQTLQSMDKTEKRVFSDEVNCNRPDFRKYPSQAATKSSFFGLGPAIPPPNPMLLSNVPSDLLMGLKRYTDPELSKIQYPDTEYVSSPSLSVDLNSTRPFDHDPSPREGLIEKFISEPPESRRPPKLSLNADGYRDGMGSAQATPQSNLERVRPTPANRSGTGIPPSMSGKFMPEFGVRNTSLETEIQDQVRYIDEQVIAILRQISDLRQQLPQLRQRELDAKDVSNIQDISISLSKFSESTKTLNKLRELLSRLQTKRKHLVIRLKEMMPVNEYNKWYNNLSNKARNAEVEIKQYHSQPADNGIIAYQRANFEGDGFEMLPGFYDYPNVGGVGNNKLQSLKVGKNVSVLLYERSKKQGQVLVYHGPRRIPVMPTLWSNRVSGIEIVEKIKVGIIAYDAPFFQGGKVRLPAGMHDYPKVGGIGVNKLSSVVIPKGFQITLYSRPNKQGERITYLGPQRLSFLPADWARKVQGIEVVLKDRVY